jgi:4-hydroxy-tetrahydrodipicolinate reductase
MSTQPRRPLRIVQWATGTVGAAAMRAVIDHPRMELVGVHVHSAAKEGRDAGELCGRPPIGVRATRGVEAVLALKPDCVLYMQEGCDFDDVCRLLEAGVNIVTTRGEFFNPKKMAPATRERVEAACRKGGASVHASGSSPGFITEALPIVLSSIQRRLDCLTIDEFADCVPGCSPDMIFNMIGFGRPAEAFDQAQLADIGGWFDQSLSLVADALNIPFESTAFSHEVGLAKTPVRIGDGVVQPGTVAALRMVKSGLRGGKPVMRFRSIWYVTTDLDVDWGRLRNYGWRVLVEGDAPLDVDIHFPIPQADEVAILPNYTANRPVNAIPYVCAAPPGVVTTADLPQIIADLGS